MKKNSVRSRKTPRSCLLRHHTGTTLGNPDLVFKTFVECLREGDAEAAIEVLAAGLRQLNKLRLERRYHLARRSAYNLMGKKSMPSIDLVAKVCHAIDREANSARSTTR